MKLINLKLRNFKGIKEFELTPGGESLSLFGDNGTGKTTLFDAFSWLLFDKDSANRKDFQIKTLNPDGDPIHGLEHEVEGILDVNDSQVTLRKVYAENWNKKRGSANREFTGHTTNYFVDGVPTKKNEYEARIASIIDEEAFKLLTNPRHFNEVLHWQDRRQLLLDVCGDLTDAEVITADSKLTKLPKILNGRSLNDHRKIIMSRRAAINKEIEMIPIRISEVERGLPNILNDPSVTMELEGLRTTRNAKAQELATYEAGGEIAEKTKELNLIEADIRKAKRERWTQIANQAQSHKIKLRTLEEQEIAAESQMMARKSVIKDKQASIIQYELKLEALREEWRTVNSEILAIEESDTCPACGQLLPAEKLEAAKKGATDNFNLRKATKLQAITDEGHAIKARVEELRTEIEGLEVQNTDAETTIAESKTKMDSLRDAIITIEKEGSQTIELPAYVELLQRKSAIEHEIEVFNNSNTDAIQAIKSEITSIDGKIAACEETIARGKQHEAGLRRIEELKAEERNLAGEFEKLEGELFLADEFVRIKVKLLEDRINSRFEMARFKLFNELINGGIEEVCETLYLGIPYGSALNNSARINIGLDIINALSEHFQFVAPIWIDNAEAVTQLIETRGQQIRLYVSEPDKVLRIEGAKEAIARH